MIIEQLPIFLLILVRFASFFVAAPIFSNRELPSQFKIGLAFFVSIVTYSTLSFEGSIPLDISYFFLIVKEALVGVSLGFVAALLLYTLQIAGGFIDFQMGFAIANVVDPQTGAQVPIIGNFKYILAILFLLSVDGHHLLIDGVIRSFKFITIDQYLVPIGDQSVALFMTNVFTTMFLIAFQIAIPVVGSIFLVDIALGMVARTVPQLNVFVVGLPLKIFVGFAVILISLATFFYLVKKIVREMMITMGALIKLLGG